MDIRKATPDDLKDMVTLIEAYRLRLAAWRPTFWKKAEGSADMSTFGLVASWIKIMSLH
jgi:hypothetical protein